MFTLAQANDESIRSCPTDDAFSGLSERWLLLKWNHLSETQTDLAKRMVSSSAAELRLRCTICKQDLPPPLIVTAVATGSYWPGLCTKLAAFARHNAKWKGHPGEVQFNTAKIGLRLTSLGIRLWKQHQWGSLRFDTDAVAHPFLHIENCQFADGTPYLEDARDPLREAEVSWSLGDSDGQSGISTAMVETKAIQPTPEKRSWKQAELDLAIAKYRDDPAHDFAALRDMVRTGSKSAYARAKSIFGRNAIVRNLGVRGAAMVTRSPVWQALALELDLQRGKCKPLPLRSYGQISMDEALEVRADLDQGTALDEMILKETHERIDELVKQGRLRFTSESHAKLFSRMLEGLLTSLNIGRTTPDEAITLTKMIIEQAQDAFRRRVVQRP